MRSSIVAFDVKRSIGLSSKRAPSLKAHSIGETVTEYLTKVKDGVGYLDACQQVQTPRQAKKLKVDYSFCLSMLAGAKGNAVFTTYFSPRLPPAPSTNERNLAKFDRGKLVLLRFTIGEERMILHQFGTYDSYVPAAIRYEDVYSDMVKEFGDPDKAASESFQTEFGVVLKGRRAVWLYHHDSFAGIFEMDSAPDEPLTLVQVATLSEMNGHGLYNSERPSTIK